MIHISKIHIAAEMLEQFSITWIEENGGKVFCPAARLTSFHSSGITMNILIIPSNLVRTVNRYTIIEFNGEEVVM